MQPEPRQSQHLEPSLELWVGPPLPAAPAGPPLPAAPAGPPEQPRAGVGRRALGWFIDFLIVMIPGLLLIGLAVRGVVQGLPEYVGSVAADVGVSRLVGLITGSAADSGVGAVVAASWFGLVRPIIIALLAVPLLQLLYHLSLLAWRGRTVGKMIADTQVRADARPRFAVRRAVATTLTETGPVGVGLALVVYGELTIGALVLGGSVVVWWVNVLPVFGPRHRTVVDRVSGTVVLRRALYAQVAARTVALARQSTDAAVVAGRMGADVAVVAAQVAAVAATAAAQRGAEQLPAAARRTTDAAVAAARVTAAAAADAAAVAGHAARHGAGRVLQTAPVQQALQSKVGQQSQALGAAGARRARKVGGRTAGLARSVGDRTQQLWQERQAARAAPPPDAPQGFPPVDPARTFPPVDPAQGIPAVDPPWGMPAVDPAWGMPAVQQPALPATAPELISPAQYFPTAPEQWRHPLP